MTREEAITTLEKIHKLLAIYPKRKKQKQAVNEIDTAIGMAIEALKGRTQEELLTHEQAWEEIGRPHGEWQNNEQDIPICSNCGYFTPYDRAIDDYEYGNFCPNCGADMRGGEGDE